MANEMIERVTLALMQTPGYSFHKDDKGMDEKDFFRDLAKVAIAAMREPTEEMLLAATSEYGHLKYLAMIDAALQEK